VGIVGLIERKNRVLEPRGFERFVPRFDPLFDVRPELFGDSVLEIEDDGLDGLRERRVGVFLLQAPAIDDANGVGRIGLALVVFICRDEVPHAIVG
jgi:hypothetical protein